MPFQKGRTKSGGRQRGTPNKLSATFREGLQQVYTDLGGHSALLQWAQANPTQFYTILARLIPMEIQELNNEPLTITVVNFSECMPITQLEDKRPPVQVEEMTGQSSHSNVGSEA